MEGPEWEEEQKSRETVHKAAFRPAVVWRCSISPRRARAYEVAGGQLFGFEGQKRTPPYLTAPVN